jgi:hypothetical protein
MVVVAGAGAQTPVSSSDDRTTVSPPTRLCSVMRKFRDAFRNSSPRECRLTFQAPQLGALPLLLTTALPGAAQMDNGKPLGLHVFSLGTP